jgi:hypothetical protein
MPMDLKGYLKDLESKEQSNNSVIDRAVRRLSQMGFDLEEPPIKGKKARIPQLPPEGISALSDRELRNLHGDFINILAYAQEQARIQKVLAEEYEVESNRVQKTVKLTLEGPVNVREDKSQIHKKVVKLQDRARECNATYQMLMIKVEKFNNGRKACSRDVEFRTRELDAERRDNAIGSIKGRRRRRSQRDLEPRS